MELVEQHYETLKAIAATDQSGVGGKLQSYARSVCDDPSECQISALPDQAVGRQYIFEMVKNPAMTTLTCCVAIFAWGGMRRNHARAVLETSAKWLPIADAIRKNEIERVEAYQRFMQARHSKCLPGMGPAFFTKLIYFLGERSESRGYIMDQWTALSANLLTGQNFIDLQKLKSAVRVSDRNTPEVYDAFCTFIESLAKSLGESPDDAEMRIFSVGGRGEKQGAWRAYLKSQLA